jgi:Uma2 family endonuclease
VLSPDDQPADVADTIATYLASGSAAVIVIDPRLETARIYDSGAPGGLPAATSLAHGALPGFALDLDSFFARLRSGR